jgi:CubicO group peptidase (beta-lactamase class C family)
MATKRLQTWLALIVLAVGGLLLAILGLFAYVSFTATPLHRNAKDVPSVSNAAPAQRWAGAVTEAQGLVRAGLTEQNLPGLSIAVGVNGDIVWAEGFGWANLENLVRRDARHALQGRRRRDGTHVDRGRSVARARPAEARR